jgi:hypothetical protein
MPPYYKLFIMIAYTVVGKACVPVTDNLVEYLLKPKLRVKSRHCFHKGIRKIKNIEAYHSRD